jgi:hypothetical protein
MGDNHRKWPVRLPNKHSTCTIIGQAAIQRQTHRVFQPQSSVDCNDRSLAPHPRDHPARANITKFARLQDPQTLWITVANRHKPIGHPEPHEPQQPVPGSAAPRSHRRPWARPLGPTAGVGPPEMLAPAPLIQDSPFHRGHSLTAQIRGRVQLVQNVPFWLGARSSVGTWPQARNQRGLPCSSDTRMPGVPGFSVTGWAPHCR